jgi:glutamine synthetase
MSTHLDHAVLEHYLSLPQGKKFQAEYVWIGGSGSDLRSKTRTLEGKVPTTPKELPVWNFDGSSTGQAPGKDSEVYLRPVAIFPDPFRRGNNILVLCDCVLPDGKETPIPTNTRDACAKAMALCEDSVPWFGIEQEYTLFENDGAAGQKNGTPYGWPKNGYPRPQGPFYCSAGAENAFGRRVADSHYRACLYAGLNISGINAEVMPGQWEYQIGPCTGIQSGDHVWMARYLMMRVCEDFGVVVSFEPKPIGGDWNGAGCHTNYSTKEMRAPGGYKAIIAAIEKLGKKHNEHIAVYGDGNELRLTGAHETAPITKFSYGVAHRGASVRIPRVAKLEGCGYFEDRRPASNMDPYKVTEIMVRTTILD